MADIGYEGCSARDGDGKMRHLGLRKSSTHYMEVPDTVAWLQEVEGVAAHADIRHVVGAEVEVVADHTPTIPTLVDMDSMGNDDGVDME